MAHSGHKYKLRITDDEISTLRFVASRGYAVQVWDALQHEDTLTEDLVDGATTFYIPEYLAWDICEENETNGGHHFGPVSQELTDKLYDFVNEVV